MSVLACGGTLSAPTGVITSPNYPNFYSVRTDCIWTIIRPPGNTVEVVFTDMDLEQNANCSFDFVEIRDGSYPTSPLIGRYCGSSKPALVRSTSNHIRILFRSDGNQVSKGFRLQYTGGESEIYLLSYHYDHEYMAYVIFFTSFNRVK